MVARLPQQVLLLLVLVTGTSPETAHESEEARWSTYAPRRTSRSLRSGWSSSSPEQVTREASRPDERIAGTTAASWSADKSNLGARLVLELRGTIVERSEEDEDAGQAGPIRRTKLKENDIGLERVAGEGSSESATLTSAKITLDAAVRRDFAGSNVTTKREVPTSATSASSFDIVSVSGTRVGTSNALMTKDPNGSTTPTTLTSKEVAFPKRKMRHIPHICEKFREGDDVKKEFYSPNYPNPYPNLTDCYRVLEADKGMLLKLDFRDEFKLEDSPDCRFDFLEVRDGQYGYSNLLGNFCGTTFPPEITSKTRYLWLRFHSDENIEGKGFKAVWSMIPRPTYPGVPPELEPCIVNVTDQNQAIIHSDDVLDRKTLAEKEGIALDCMWVIKVKEGFKIQLSFSENFKLQRPNECDANFVDIFHERTDMASRKRSFCGSIADTVNIKTNLVYVRFYAEPKALNSSFDAVMTAIREKETGEKNCRENEYDCEDATCIAAELRCNDVYNCRFRWDEEDPACEGAKKSLTDSQHIVIILVVFSLIMFGMSFAFVFNCIRKLVRDHRIIQEHIRQSRENRLDELGRKSTPCPISASRTDIGDRGSESPSLEVVPSKELLPPTTLIAQEYTKDLVHEMTYNTRDMNDIHQSNNVSNATQERLQESSEEPEMRDNFCQTRESLFEPRGPDAVVQPAFTTFGFRLPNSQNGTNHHHHRRHHHHHHHPQTPPPPPHSHQTSQSPHLDSQSPQDISQQISQCSGCSPASRGRDGSMGICPKHNPIPAPPGWSSHEASYPLSTHQSTPYPEPPDYPSYQRFQSPKPSREGSGAYRQSPKFVRQGTVGSGERYGSSIYGSGQGSSNTTSTSQHSSTPKCQQTTPDPRYRAEAVIEVDQRRPFSIQSTKSAPDVIATH